MDIILSTRSKFLLNLTKADIASSICQNSMDETQTLKSIDNVYNGTRFYFSDEEIKTYILSSMSKYFDFSYKCYVGSEFPPPPKEYVASDIAFDLGPVKIYIYSLNGCFKQPKFLRERLGF